MCAHEIKGDQVTHLLVKFGGALQVCEQERQAGYLEPLLNAERIGVINVTEGLIAEQALRSDEWLPPRKQLIEFWPGDPNSRQRAGIITVLNIQPDGPWAQRRDGRL